MLKDTTSTGLDGLPSLCPIERAKRFGRSIRKMSEIGCECMRDRYNKPRFVARELSECREILEARRFAIERFAGLGKIDEASIHQDGEHKGLLKRDSLLDRSIFFGVYEGGDTLVATARFVWTPDITIGDTRMPLDQLDERAQRRLEGIPAGRLAEFASFAKTEGASHAAPLKLIREMVLWSYANDVQYWTSGLEPNVFPLYCRFFGDTMTRLHEDTVVFSGINGVQVPILVDLGESLEDGLAVQYSNSCGIGARATKLAVRSILRS